MLMLVTLITSPVALNVSFNMPTPIWPTSAALDVILVPVTLRLPLIVELDERWADNVSVSPTADDTPVDITSAAPSMEALKVLPPLAAWDRFATTTSTFVLPDDMLNAMLEKLYLPATGADVFHCIKSYVVSL